MPPWSSTDIGNVGQPRTASFSNPQTYFAAGAGTDIWGTTDSSQFVWHQLSGDGEIVVRVLAERATDQFAKAGAVASRPNYKP